MDARPRTVSNAVARALLHAAESLDVSGEQLLRLAGLTPAEVMRPRGRVIGHKHQKLVRLTANAPVEWGGFLREGLVPLFTDYPNLAAVCANCPTARGAIDTFLHHRAVIGELDVFVCHGRDDGLLFDYLPDDPHDQGVGSALANFALVVKVMRHYQADAGLGFACALRGPPPRQREAVDDFFGGPVAYLQPANRLQVKLASLDAPFAQHNPLLHQVFQGHLTAELAAIRRPDSFASRVEGFVRDAFAAERGGPELTDDGLLQELCSSLHLTRWSVRRRLQRDGCSYKDLVARVKLAEAQRLLRDGATPVAEISDLLGFASPGSFTRFFKAQEGVTPVVYRQSAGPVPA